jgi:pullulanase
MRNWIFKDSDFLNFPVYNGNDLGVFWSPEKTFIRIWAPTANRILFRLYREGFGGDATKEYPMQKDQSGTWILEIQENLENLFYTFQVRDNSGWLNEGPDIYAKAVGINGKRGAILDFRKTNPPSWEIDKRCSKTNPVDMIIYEVHIRDFSIASSSGVKKRGKYSGFIEKGTKLPSGESTGLDHLLELGISHVHLLPVSDFYTVDESKSSPQYNWGYDPLNFNSPEGWYSTNPTDASLRILELKQLIKTLHENGIGVILDVVYNHSGLIFESYFNQTVPGYFYRLNDKGEFSDASGCGTELATEREMVRKFIIESICYWAEEYHIDGFRFDLMGIIDIETMNMIRKCLDKLDPNIFMYGEGWTAGPSPYPDSKRAVKINTNKLDRIASFSDDIRNGLKGSPFDKFSKGFINGETLREEQVKFGIVGAIQHDQIIYSYVDTSKVAWANQPGQCINYVSCHDNFTVFDKLQYSSPEVSMETIERMARLAMGIIFTSQGVPFMLAGEEMLRTKGGVPDSYRSPDELNKIEWKRKARYSGMIDYTKKCIELRKNHPAFRMPDAEMIRKKLRFFGKYIPGTISYELGDHANNDSWKKIIVLLNGNNYSVELDIPGENWLIIAQNGEIFPNGAGYTKTSRVRIHPISMMIYAAEKE